MISVTNNRSSCPVSTSLEIIGDHWTLILIRDFFLNRVTFSDFKNSRDGNENKKKLRCKLVR